MNFDINHLTAQLTALSNHTDWVATGELSGVVVVGLIVVGFIIKKTVKKKPKNSIDDDVTENTQSDFDNHLDANTLDVQNEYQNLTMDTKDFSDENFTHVPKNDQDILLPNEDEHIAAISPELSHLSKSEAFLHEAMIADEMMQRDVSMSLLNKSIEEASTPREKLRLKVITQEYINQTAHETGKPLLADIVSSNPSTIDNTVASQAVEDTPATSQNSVVNEKFVEEKEIVLTPIPVMQDSNTEPTAFAAPSQTVVRAEPELIVISHATEEAKPVEPVSYPTTPSAQHTDLSTEALNIPIEHETIVEKTSGFIALEEDILPEKPSNDIAFAQTPDVAVQHEDHSEEKEPLFVVKNLWQDSEAQAQHHTEDNQDKTTQQLEIFPEIAVSHVISDMSLNSAEELKEFDDYNEQSHQLALFNMQGEALEQNSTDENAEHILQEEKVLEYAHSDTNRYDFSLVHDERANVVNVSAIEETHTHENNHQESVHITTIAIDEITPADVALPETHEHKEVSDAVSDTIRRMMEDTKALETESTTEDDENRFYQAFGDMVQDLSAETGLISKTEEKMEHIDSVKRGGERDTVWVNWMAQIDGRASLRNHYIELEHAWGTRSAVEELHRFLTHYAGIDDNGMPNSWAVMSVYVVK